MKKLIILVLIVITNTIAHSQDFISIKNKFLKVIVDKETGQFYIKTTGGSPRYTFDDNKKIIDKYASTFLSLNIDDFIFKYSEKSGKFIAKFYIENNKLKSIWENDNIKVFQTIEFVKYNFSEYSNTVKLTYKILNIDKYPIKIGARLLLDTSLGDDDILKFRLLDNTIISSETELKNMPFFWFGYKYISDPKVFVFNAFDIKNPPDKIIFASLAKISKTLWDYKPDKKNHFRKEIITKPDSGVAIYWEPKTVKPDDIIEFSTFYGILDTVYDRNKNFSFFMFNSHTITNNSPAKVLVNIKNISSTNLNNFKLNLSGDTNLLFTKNVLYKKVFKRYKTINFSTLIDTKKNIRKTYPVNINITGSIKNKKLNYSYSDFVISKKYFTNIHRITNNITKIIKETNKLKEAITVNTQKFYTRKTNITKPKPIPIAHTTNTNITTIKLSFLIYYIRKGDTLSEILARLFKIFSWKEITKYIDAIAEYNKIKNNDLIYEHNYIFIPCINIESNMGIKDFAKNFLNGDIKKIVFINSNMKNHKTLNKGTVILIKDYNFLKSGKFVK